MFHVAPLCFKYKNIARRNLRNILRLLSKYLAACIGYVEYCPLWNPRVCIGIGASKHPYPYLPYPDDRRKSYTYGQHRVGYCAEPRIVNMKYMLQMLRTVLNMNTSDEGLVNVHVYLHQRFQIRSVIVADLH